MTLPPQLRIAASVHRIGGDDAYPDRSWGQPNWVHVISTNGKTSLSLDARTTAMRFVRLELEDWREASPGWLGLTLGLVDMNLYPFGRAPALLYAEPYHIPTHTNFYVPDAGVFSVALRIC
jgi:hypothetical protein